MNRYDVPAQDRYFNTYVDLPYEQIMGTVAARQAQVDRAQEALNKNYEDTQNLEYIPDTQDEQYIRDYVSKVSDLTNKYMLQDMSDPIVAGQLRSEFNRMTNKQHLKNIQMSKQAWDVNNKLKAQLTAEGLYDPILDEDPSKLSSFSTINDGVYNYVTSPYKNPDPIADTYFKDLKAGDLGNRGDYWYEGVDKKRIDEVVNAKWGSFADTSEGRQYVKKMAIQSGQDPNDPVVREKIAKEYLRDVGYSQWTWENRGGVLPQGKTGRGSGSQNSFEAILAPTKSAPAVNVIGNKRWTGHNLLEAQKEYDSSSKELQNKINDLSTNNPNDPSINQLKLELQSISENKERVDQIINNAKDIATQYYQDDIDKAEKKLRSNALKNGTTPEELKKKYELNNLTKEAISAVDFTPLNNGIVGGAINKAISLSASKFSANFPSYFERYLNKVNNINRDINSKFNDEVKNYSGSKSTYGKRIMPSPVQIDESDNAYYMDAEGSKRYASSSGLLRDLKEHPETFNVIQEYASSESNRKARNAEITDLQENIRGASKALISGISPNRNDDGTLDIEITTKQRSKNNNVDVADRTMKVRLTDPTHIRALAEDLFYSGRQVEASMIMDPQLSDDIKTSIPSKVGESITVTPHEGFYPYKIKKIDTDLYSVLDQNGNKVTSGGKELPDMSLDDIIHYMYQVKNYVRNTINAQ